MGGLYERGQCPFADDPADRPFLNLSCVLCLTKDRRSVPNNNQFAWSGARRLFCVIIHGVPEPLLAFEVPLGCLNGNVAEQELDLFEFTACWWQSRAQVRRKSCGATVGRPQFFALAFTIPQITLGANPVFWQPSAQSLRPYSNESPSGPKRTMCLPVIL